MSDQLGIDVRSVMESPGLIRHGEVNLSIIIVNWNTRDLLVQCLQSVYANPLNAEFEVFVVDNASSDGSAAMVRERFLEVQLIENTENIGFARANNQAMRQARGRYVLLLNSDAIVLPETMSRLIAFADQHPEAGAIGCVLLNPEGTLQPSAGKGPALLYELLTGMPLAQIVDPHCDIENRRLVPIPEDVDYFEVEHIGGAFMLARAEVIQKVGLLDEGFFLYGEESDWCYRIRQAGWRIYYYVRVAAIHHIGASTDQIGSQRVQELYRGKYRYFKKHRGWLAAEILRCIVLLRGASRIGYDIAACWLSTSRNRGTGDTSASGFSLLKTGLSL